MKRTRYFWHLIFFALATTAFLCCKKKSVSTPITNPTHSPLTTISKIAGNWSLHGTVDKSIYHGPGMPLTYTHDTEILTMSVFIADSVTMVYNLKNYYNVCVLYSQDNSILYFKDVNEQPTMVFNIVNNSVVYSRNWDYGGKGFDHETLSSSPTHVAAQNNSAVSNTAKMAGTKQWHGSLETEYIPPYYTGRPTVDTTYFYPLTMQINALSDSLILDRIDDVLNNSVLRYLVFRKTFDNQLITVFTNEDNTDGIETITYYSASNSMFYFDSSYTSPFVYKYYTP